MLLKVKSIWSSKFTIYFVLADKVDLLQSYPASSIIYLYQVFSIQIWLLHW